MIRKYYRSTKKLIKQCLFKSKLALLNIHEVPKSVGMSEYQKAFESFVSLELPIFYESVKPFYISRINNPDSLIYFRQQLPRFWKMIQILERNSILPKSIAELGSFYPYASYYFYKHYGSSIVLHDIIHRVSGASLYDTGKIKLIDCDIVAEPIGQYDLYFFTMVIEHLPCDLYAFCDKLVEAMPSGSYLYVSYPTGGKNAKDYDKQLDSDSGKLYDAHLREFTYSTTSNFFRRLKIVDRERVFVPCAGYSEEILYVKDEA